MSIYSFYLLIDYFCFKFLSVRLIITVYFFFQIYLQLSFESINFVFKLIHLALSLHFLCITLFKCLYVRFLSLYLCFLCITLFKCLSIRFLSITPCCSKSIRVYHVRYIFIWKCIGLIMFDTYYSLRFIF